MNKRQMMLIYFLIIEITIIFSAIVVCIQIKSDNCDVNRDGKVDVYDLQIVHKRIIADGKANG